MGRDTVKRVVNFFLITLSINVLVTRRGWRRKENLSRSCSVWDILQEKRGRGRFNGVSPRRHTIGTKSFDYSGGNKVMQTRGPVETSYPKLFFSLVKNLVCTNLFHLKDDGTLTVYHLDWSESKTRF